MRSASFNPFAPLVLLALAVVAPAWAQTAATQPAAVTFPMAVGEVLPLAQPVADAATSVTAVCAGKYAPVVLPIVADTSLWKGSNKPAGEGKSLVLRDGRWSQALLKLDVESLENASITSATLRFTATGVERKGQPATFKIYRLLTPWNGTATWDKPDDADGRAWAGLKPGTDFDPKPIASLNVEKLADKQLIEIPDLETAITAWRDGTWPNHGFLLLLEGKALQCTLASAEGSPAGKFVTLGGPTGGSAVVGLNLPLFQRVVLQPEDLQGLALQLHVQLPRNQKGPMPKLEAYRLLRPRPVGVPKAGIDFDSTPLAVTTAEADGTVTLSGLQPLVRQALATSQPDAPGLLLRAAEGSPAVTLSGLDDAKNKPTWSVTLRAYPRLDLFENPVRPRSGTFASVRNGHLFYGEQRLRLWGVVGYPDVGRLHRMGFNAQRVWDPRRADIYDAESAARGEAKTYVKGDGSKWDKTDKHLAELRDAGMFVMYAGLQDTMPLNLVKGDNSFVAGGDDWQAWKEAVSGKKVDDTRWIFVDERLQKIRKQHAKNLLTHVNPYTGKAYGQDECFAIYEVFNENGGIKRLLEGSYTDWPPYFRTKLQKRWNAWLQQRYKSDAALAAAWGKLEKDESLAAGTVTLGPSFQTRNDFPVARGNDFVHFLIDLVDGFHQDFRAYCRTLAPAGVGVNVAPFSFDTQYRPSLAWNYLQSRGDVNCPGMYFWDLTSTLDKPPSAYVIDSNTVSGCATVLYETNAGRPGPYRAEYPFKLVALANWQDWDGIVWHYWGNIGGEVDEAYLASPMLHTSVSHFWDAVHHENDPVMCSALALAGRMFLNFSAHAAPKPADVEVGTDGLFSYDNHNGFGLAQQAFRTGARISFKPDKAGGVTQDGQPLPEPQRVSAAVAAGDQILWDWPNGRLIIDTPTAKAYAGKISGNYKFKDGIVLGDVGTPFVVFSMLAADGKPLVGPDASRRIYLSAVFDAKNTGFAFDWTVKGGPVDQARAIHNRGKAPVIVDHVPYSLWFPTQLQGRFDGYDFALRPCMSKPIASTNRISHDGRELYMGVLTVESRGAPAAVPAVEAPKSVETLATGGPGPADVRPADPHYSPIPGVGWELGYNLAHQALRNSPLVFTSISKWDAAASDVKTIQLSEAQLPTLWKAPADLELTFDHDRLKQITVTFKRPPAFADAVSDYARRFGEPAEKNFASQFETSVARWAATASRPAITMTESQGIFKILYDLPKP